MNNSTDAQVAAASWTDVLEALAGFSDTKFLESIQEDLVVSVPGHVSSAGSELPIFNAVSDTAFTPAPTTSMGAYTNLTNQTNHTFPVSRLMIVDIDLPCCGHRILPLGPCKTHVRPILGSPKILRVHQILKVS
jgi:hypothetical protein